MGHDFDAPPALEMLLTRLDEMRTVLGPGAGARLGAVRADLERAIGLRAGGDAPAAAVAIRRAMAELAGLADAVDPAEGALMRAAVEVFGTALLRGAAGEMEQTAELMRERSGARKVEKKP
jgi:hypothetical protein